MSIVSEIGATIFSTARKAVKTVAKKTNTSIFTPAKKAGVNICDNYIPCGRATRLDVAEALSTGNKIKRASNIKARQALNSSGVTGFKRSCVNIENKVVGLAKGGATIAKKVGVFPAVTAAIGFEKFFYIPFSTTMGLTAGIYIKNVLKIIFKTLF